MVSREQATGPVWKTRMLFLLLTELEGTIQCIGCPLQTFVRAAIGKDASRKRDSVSPLVHA
jgi:hypothetical protein